MEAPYCVTWGTTLQHAIGTDRRQQSYGCCLCVGFVNVQAPTSQTLLTMVTSVLPLCAPEFVLGNSMTL